MSLSFHKLLSALHFINHTLTHFDPSSDLKLRVLLCWFSLFFELMNSCSHNKSSDCELGGLYYWYLLSHFPSGCPKENKHALICAIGWVLNFQKEFEKGWSFLVISDYWKKTKPLQCTVMAKSLLLRLSRTTFYFRNKLRALLAWSLLSIQPGVTYMTRKMSAHAIV